MKRLKQIIKGYFLYIKYYIDKDYRYNRKIEAKKRILICETCNNFNKIVRNCKLCGCLMDIKTKMFFDYDENGISIDGCEDKKW
ncbi:hypothetical protein M0Q50_06555 [bacterium]|jgi:hypothetical protein|nr:hypothetical protein [bacterium]